MLSTLVKPILTILILFIPLYPKFPLYTVKGTHVFIRLDDIVVASAVFIWILYQINQHFPVLKQRINKLFFLYFLAIILSTTHALLIFQTEPTHILFLHLARRFQYMSLFFITISAIRKPKNLSFPYISLLITTFLVCLYGYGQKYLNFPVISTMNSEFAKGQLLQMSNWTRINSTFAGHYDLASFLSVILVIIGGIAITTKKTIIKYISITSWLIAFHSLTLTASRISIFALWGAITITIILLKKYLWIIPTSLIITFSMLTSKDLNQRLIATLYTAFPTKTPTSIPTAPTPTVNPDITPLPANNETIILKTTPLITPKPTVFRHQIDQPPLIDADTGVARSGEIRFKAEWPRAITAYKKNPLSGTGLGSITLATDNAYLRLLGESGILGFTTFFFILNNLNIILFGATLSFLANAVFIDVFEASKTAYMFWIMMGVYHQNIQFTQKNVK